MGYREFLTISTYDDAAVVWARAHDTANFWLNEFTELKGLLPSGRILEIGVGGGRDIPLLKSVYDYFGIDLSFGFLRVAKSRSDHLSHQTLYNIAFPDNSFDGLWASAVLLHIPKTEIVSVLSELRRVMKNGAKGFVSIKEGNTEEINTQEGITRFFAYYQDQEFRNVLQRAGASILRFDTREGASAKWLKYFIEFQK